MSELFSPSIVDLESAMRFRLARQPVLAGNVSNAETPGYRRFDVELKNEIGKDKPGMAATHDRHISSQSPVANRYSVQRGEYGGRPDRNGVDLDGELLQMSRNAGAFEQQAEVLSRIYTLHRIAVTGEPR